MQYVIQHSMIRTASGWVYAPIDREGALLPEVSMGEEAGRGRTVSKYGGKRTRRIEVEIGERRRTH